MRNYLIGLVGALALAGCTNESSTDKDGRRAVDNTANNEGDEQSHAVTPLNQKENARDLELTQRIRQGIVADASLSFTAKNSKIVAQNGIVTLRGVVDSDQERAAIGTIARESAGTEAVRNQLEVKK